MNRRLIGRFWVDIDANCQFMNNPDGKRKKGAHEWKDFMCP